jgi:hypothetical protein
MDHYGRYAVANQYYGGSYHFDHHGYGYGIGYGHGYQYLRGHCRDGDRDDSDVRDRFNQWHPRCVRWHSTNADNSNHSNGRERKWIPV